MASLEVGIVGLPNVGKTSVFNALTGAGAEITGYAATKTSANVGVAAVPDARAGRAGRRRRELARAASRRRSASRTSPGCGAAPGSSDGLGGEFLGHLRATDALAHVVRCFEDESVFHVEGRVDPVGRRRDGRPRAAARRRRARRAAPASASSKAARVGEKDARDELAAARAARRPPRRRRAGAHVRRASCPADLDLLTRKPGRSTSRT